MRIHRGVSALSLEISCLLGASLLPKQARDLHPSKPYATLGKPRATVSSSPRLFLALSPFGDRDKYLREVLDGGRWETLLPCARVPYSLVFLGGALISNNHSTR